MQTNRIEKISQDLLAILMNHRRGCEKAGTACLGKTCLSCRWPHQSIIQQAVSTQRPLTMILPAFPAKSANRQKTLSEKPDRGEIMGLNNLNTLCQNMQALYEPGIRLIICSDGRVFNDLVLVSEEAVNVYQQGINKLIKQHEFNFLSTFSLDDIYPSLGYQTMRELLMLQYGQSLEALMASIKMDEHHRYQFNGIHRFILEDQLVLKPDKSKNQVRKEAKQTAYEVIQRSNAWSRLLTDYFPQSLRLSIHPQPCGSEKLGIQFLPAANRWATPWHNVLLKNAKGWELVKRQEAELLGAVLNNDHYVLEAC